MMLQKPYRNLNNRPKQYIQGFVEFYKLKFKVNEDVLIPRPETELLVDEVLKFAKSIPSTLLREYSLSESSSRSVTILDLGTGAGNIAISIAKNLPSTRGVKITATDISNKALKIAKKNAKFHGVEDKITFLQSNLLSKFNHTSYAIGHPLLIVTNLPYIPSARIPYLDSSVKDFEPKVALDGGYDGFELYRKLFQQLKDRNIKFNFLVGEIDYTHGELSVLEAQKYFPDMQSEVKLDLFHRQRILTIRKLNP